MNVALGSDLPRACITTAEDLLAGRFSGDFPCLLTRDRSAEPLIRSAADRLGPALILQECWSGLFSRCGVLISSALSGGSFLQRLREAPEGRSWLLLEPISMVFPLPCPVGQGLPAAPPDHGPVFFSEALFCQYTHFLRDHQGVMQLWDTAETLQRKLALAGELGFCGWAMEE